MKTSLKDFPTRQQQADAAGVKKVLGFQGELRLRGLLDSALQGVPGALEDFQQFVQFAPVGMKHRCLEKLNARQTF